MRMLNDPRSRDSILKEAKTVWQRTIDTSEKNVRMTDDGKILVCSSFAKIVFNYDKAS